MFASLEVHTNDTIAEGRKQVARFYKLLTVCFFVFLLDLQHAS